MPKKIKTTTTLVIVESPAKCKKIEEYLGPGYKCVATYGHIRELPSLKNIDIENNFNPTYTLIDNAIKRKNIETLRNEIKNASEVILALDDDIEVIEQKDHYQCDEQPQGNVLIKWTQSVIHSQPCFKDNKRPHRGKILLIYA